MKRFLLDDCKSRMIVKEKIREGWGRGEIYALFSTARARAPRRCALACNMCMRHGRSLVRVASRPTTAKPMVMVKAKVMVMGFFGGGGNYFSQCSTYSHSARAETHHGHLFLPHTTQSFSSIKAP
jgi:hypothetical protein